MIRGSVDGPLIGTGLLLSLFVMWAPGVDAGSGRSVGEILGTAVRYVVDVY
jgi:hypothetical protein